MNNIEQKYNELERKIEKLENQIEYEKKKMKVCAYGTSDLIYLSSLESELDELIEQRDNLD